ncbi:hypothetical protein JCM19240_4096 [Vibrio maritimus]|uniref:Uncharacterized protein n=1 Tax=Vibrio maritimus TaxID=990268 RepID=A0A090T3Q3_9VIBR|nr:hypothetical protein JCM19240_4096 [Vibrio maritimus]
MRFDKSKLEHFIDVEVEGAPMLTITNIRAHIDLVFDFESKASTSTG